MIPVWMDVPVYLLKKHMYSDESLTKLDNRLLNRGQTNLLSELPFNIEHLGNSFMNRKNI